MGHYQEIRALGGDVLVISFAQPNFVTMYRKDKPLPFPVVSDPTLAAYRAFGLERVSWASFLRSGTILKYLALIFRGWIPRRPNEGEDVLQLGGDFILDEQRRLVYAFRGKAPTDRPSARELVEAVRSAASVG
jgi:peroxiredoxin